MDDWPLARILLQISGGKPGLVTVDSFGVTGLRRPPLEGRMSQPRGCCLRAPSELLRRTGS